MKKHLLIIICIAVSVMHSVAAAGGFELFTPEEASQLNLTDADLQTGLKPTIRKRGLLVGPKINFQMPATHEDKDGSLIVEMHANSPLAIEFIPTVADVDMDSLEVEAEKGLFSVSLTDRLRPYLHGNKLEAKEIKIPNGHFTVNIHIADKKGTSTEKDYLFVVGD